MHRVVLDTNVIISALGWNGAEREVLELCLKRKIQLIESRPLLDELIKVLSRPRFKFINAKKKTELLDSLIQISEAVAPTEKINAVKDDPSDNKFLETAVEGKADYIISGDNHLLKLRRFRRIRIVNAKEFLRVHFNRK